MNWHIDGTDSETGKDASIEVEASNEKDALFIAKGRGISVQNIRPIPTGPPVSSNKKTREKLPRLGFPVVLFLLSLAAIFRGYENLQNIQEHAQNQELMPLPSDYAEITDVILFFGCIGLLVSMVMLSTIPGKIADYRGHPSVDAIRICGICGIFFGFVFWIVAYIWAHTGPNNHTPI